jgi:quercetin dioxygenase-like cupin family protein/alkylhydroperoxidase/carboxymuconolactone decarboxylase family protein YurZ
MVEKIGNYKIIKNMNRIIITIFAICFAITLNAQNMNSLDKKQQEIVRISAAAAIGDLENLKTALNNGLDAGLTINEVKEILIQMYAYTGFPRSLNAINTLIAVFEERKTKGISDKTGEEPTGFSDKNKYAKGKQTLETLTGRKETELTGANAFTPAIDEFLKEHLFADIFGRGVLTYEQRELATVSALSALGNVTPQLNSHRSVGKYNGLTDGQIGELSQIVQNGQKAVYPKGNQLSNDRFSGVAWLQSLVTTSDTEGFYSIGQVTFEAAARTYWHTHPAGQILLCTDGYGWYQERGKPARKLAKGEVVIIPKDVEHWHGAASDSPFVHIAVTNYRDGSGVTWLGAVTDEEYNNLEIK